MKPSLFPTRCVFAALAVTAAAPLQAQTPTPAVITPPGGGVILTGTPTPTPPARVVPEGGGAVITTSTPMPTAPARVLPADGGAVSTIATPMPTAPARVLPAGGGAVSTIATPMPTAPARVLPAGGGAVSTIATPMPTAPARVAPVGGGIVTTTSTPLPTPPTTVTTGDGGVVSTLATPAPVPLAPMTALAVAHERRLVREVQQNTDNIKSKANFGAQLWLITDADFFLNWRKPETPALVPISIALRGQPVYTAIIFYGSAKDEKGLENVSYDVTVRRPDNSVYAESKDLVGFQNLGPDERQLQLGRNYLAINLAATDPAGLYTVETVVHDNNGRIDLPLVQHFVVQPQ